MDKRKVTLALVIDMYAHKITGKHTSTYLKLQLPVVNNRYEVIEVDLEIPNVDIQSRRVSVGKKVLIERVDKEHIVYLGPEGDWETMMKWGISPDDKATFNQKFHGFSQNETSVDGIEYIMNGNNLKIKAGEVILAEASIEEDGAHDCRYNGEIGKKLLIDYCRPRGINFPIKEKLFNN